MAFDKKIIVFCMQQLTCARLPVALRMRMAPHICNTYAALPAATAVAQRTGSAALIKLSGDAGSYAACGMATAHNLGGL
ncbi:hypothetical protein [Xanthomonas arboricola]|uniref:hypothetical protein n=1 Tax=Xanthomonas arboricola TaxID=56448 RepID=UPI00141A9D89|nr:hypothetical protein [Xanthomonas arboricola]NIK42560.1 hypothetical protein [Xanthomonas arboricola]